MKREVFRVEGLREIKAALEDVSKATSTNILKKALIEAGQPIASAARSMAPDDPTTGGYDLKKSITVGTRLSRRQKKRNKKGSKVEVYVGAGPLSQATQQEFGNALHGPQAFLRPAWDSNKAQALQIFIKAVWSNIEKAAARAARKTARLAAKS
jgi:HK97 gp10 family phage protein